MSDWNKYKSILFVITNHSSFKEIEAGLFNLEYSAKSNNKKYALYYAEIVNNKINELKEITRFDLGNILQVKNKMLKY